MEKCDLQAERMEAELASVRSLGPASPAAEPTDAETLERENNELRSELSLLEERHRAELAREAEQSGAFLLTKLSDSEAKSFSTAGAAFDGLSAASCTELMIHSQIHRQLHAQQRRWSRAWMTTCKAANAKAVCTWYCTR